jgi:hypothetical protein
MNLKQMIIGNCNCASLQNRRKLEFHKQYDELRAHISLRKDNNQKDLDETHTDVRVKTVGKKLGNDCSDKGKKINKIKSRK